QRWNTHKHQDDRHAPPRSLTAQISPQNFIGVYAEETVMLDRSSIAAIVLAAALLTTIAPAQAFDESRYPDLNGQWIRAHPRSQWDPNKPRGLQQQAPLTAEYQAIFEANLKSLHSGNLGADPQVHCFPSGMPRMMIA